MAACPADLAGQAAVTDKTQGPSVTLKALLLVGLCLALWAVPVLGQEPPALASLDLSLWPEYDRPALLVIYRGQFAAETALPLAVEFRIPAAAGIPHAVAYLDEQDQPIQQEYTTQQDGDALLVAMTLPSRGFQLEYYLPLPAADDAGQRLIPFIYTADYPVTVLSIEVMEPLGAEAFRLDPAADRASTADNGLTYHVAAAGPLAQNESASWNIAYTKADTGLTAAALQSRPAATTAAPPAQATSTPAAGAKVPGWLVALAALLALIAVGAGAFWLGRHSRPTPQEAPAGRRRGGKQPARHKQPARQEQPPAGSQEATYCYRCGAQTRPGSDFCHQCGAAVRQIPPLPERERG